MICSYLTHKPHSCGHMTFIRFLFQVDHFSGCCGGHLRDFRHVLHPGQLRPLPHPGASDQGQAPAVCERSQPLGLLGGQLFLGHGARTIDLNKKTIIRDSPVISLSFPSAELLSQHSHGGWHFHGVWQKVLHITVQPASANNTPAPLWVRSV